MSEIGPATRVQQSRDTVSRDVGGQLVILTPKEGTIHELDELGNFIWSLCADPISVEEITTRIVSEYDVEATIAQQDLTEFLGKMIDVGAVIEQ
jgi:hypothetical protein